MREANDVLRTLRDLSLPLLAYAVFAPIATFVVPSRRSREERFQRLVLVGKVMSMIVAIFFVGIEGSDIVNIMRARPIWGIYVMCLLIAGLGIVLKLVVERARMNRNLLTITGSNAERARDDRSWSSTVAVGAWLAACAVAVFWLSRIAGNG